MKSTARMLTRPRYDETLYSALARASAYLGYPPRARFHDSLLGEDVSIFDDLPVGIGRIVASGILGPSDHDGAVHEWTMFPYYAHFVDPARALGAMRRMEGDGEWPHEALGCQTTAPDRLRFCASCRVDMLDQWPDAWWRRSHQMPSALVCPDHGETLLESAVTRERRRKEYIAPTHAECPADVPAVVVIDGGVSRDDLLSLARASDALLDERCDVHPDDRREGYLRRLGRRKLLNRAGEAKLAAIAKAMDGRWGSTLNYWPDLTTNQRCAQGWLGRLLMGEQGSPPLHHLLLEGYLSCFRD